MKTNIWNIKEILNIPSGGSKISSRSGASSDYSSLTDSQFLLESQFWPESSLALSQDVSLSSRNTKQNSEEGNELRVSANYHAKPYLFGRDTETYTTTNSKPAIGVLNKFEEDKKRAKEKSESETIQLDFLKLHDSLEKAICLLELVKNGGEDAQKGLMEGICSLTKTIKEGMVSVWDGLTPKIEAVITKLNSQSQTLKEMEDRETKLVTATKDLSAHLQDLQRNMESMKVEHGQEQAALAKMQLLLTATMEAQSWVSVARPVQMVSSEVQTSPGLVERFCVVSEEKRVFQGVCLCGPSDISLPVKSSDPDVDLTSASKQTRTHYDQTVPTKADLCPLPINQEGHVMHVASDGMSRTLWQQAFCSQVPDSPGDFAVSDSPLQSRGQYAFRQGALHNPGDMDTMEDSQMMAITDESQNSVMPVRKVTPPAFTQRRLQKTRSKKRPRGKTRALIPQNAVSVYRGSGQRHLCSSRADGEEEEKEEEEENEQPPLYPTKNKASCEKVQPSFMLRQSKEVSMQNETESLPMCSSNAKCVRGLRVYEGANRQTKAKAEIAQKALGGLWNLFSFDDSD